MNITKELAPLAVSVRQRVRQAVGQRRLADLPQLLGQFRARLQAYSFEVAFPTSVL